VIPCGNLHTSDPPRCEIGRRVPEDCGDQCSAYLPGINLEERTRCEVWTRVMGYHRPISAANPGKQQEHRDRRYFRDQPGDLDSEI